MEYLDFEQPIQELEEQLQKCCDWYESDVDVTTTCQIEDKLLSTKKEIYGNLTPWQRVQLSRHPQRPYTMDYIKALSGETTELHGDRTVKDDKAMVCGFGKIGDQSFLFIGQQKDIIQKHVNTETSE